MFSKTQRIHVFNKEEFKEQVKRKKHLEIVIPPSFISDDVDLSLEEFPRYKLPFSNRYRFKILGKDTENLKKLIVEYGGEIVQESHNTLVCSKEDILEDYRFYLKNIKNVPYIIDKIKFEKYLQEFDVLDQNPKIEEYFVNDLFGIVFDSDFPLYKERVQTRKMNCTVKKKEKETQIIDKIPNEILLHIFRFLDLKDHLSTRLLCKELSYYDIEYWENHCIMTWIDNPWLPDIFFADMNVNKQHWFQFFREHMNPLLIDRKILENYLEDYKNEVDIDDYSNCAVFIDTKESLKEVEIGKSKFGGKPHLPKDFEWPDQCSFLAQINLEDLSQFFSFQKTSLPQKGILYFFEKISFRTLCYYYNETNNLSIAEPPNSLGKDDLLQIYELKFYEAINIVFENNINPNIRVKDMKFQDLCSFLKMKKKHVYFHSLLRELEDDFKIELFHINLKVIDNRKNDFKVAHISYMISDKDVDKIKALEILNISYSMSMN